MQVELGVAAGAAIAVAVGAVIADRRRNNRADPERVGFMPWPLIQVLAFLTAIILLAFASAA